MKINEACELLECYKENERQLVRNWAAYRNALHDGEYDVIDEVHSDDKRIKQERADIEAQLAHRGYSVRWSVNGYELVKSNHN